MKMMWIANHVRAANAMVVGIVVLVIAGGSISVINNSRASPLLASERSGCDIPRQTDGAIAVASAETQRPPREVEQLCSNQGEQNLVTKEGQQHTFYQGAAYVERCEGGKVWKAAEDGSKVNDAATFYFDADGALMDICQPLFWRSGCERFDGISCEQYNYCEER